MPEHETNMFHIVEAINEHINMLWQWYGNNGGNVQIEKGRRVINGSVGDFDHELVVIERYTQDLLNELAERHPEIYRRS
jgi:hypothetical protein